MEDFDGVILFVLGLIVAVALFFGVTTAIKKSMRPPQGPAFDSREMQTDQRMRMDAMKRQREQAIRDQQRKIRDLQRLNK